MNVDECKNLYRRLLDVDGRQIRAMRKEVHLTMQELADVCRVTRQTIFALENDHKDQPSAFHVQDSTKLLVILTLRNLSSSEDA